jgi:hypothetical protein
MAQRSSVRSFRSVALSHRSFDLGRGGGCYLTAPEHLIDPNQVSFDCSHFLSLVTTIEPWDLMRHTQTPEAK